MSSVRAAGPSVAARERRGLLVSIVVTAILGAVGVAWGLVSGSQMILLDGIYAVIGIATSWLLLRASALAAQGPTRSYPFGREAVTPLVIGIQGTILTATLLYAAAEAVFTILRGGSEVTAGSGIAYSILITAASIVVWRWLQRSAGTSDLLVAETTAWRIAALRGVGMIVGFSVLLVISGSSLDRFAAYVDPVMVLVTCVAFLPPPLRMVRSTILELLESSPPPRITEPVNTALDRVKAEFELRDVTIRMTKIGPKLYLEVEATARPEITIGQMGGLREDIERGLAHLPYEVWLNLELRPPSLEG